MKIPVAHDFICEWCWIGVFQARRLRDEYGFEIEWVPYELYPAELEEKTPDPAPPPPANKPLTPSRLTLAFAAAGMDLLRRPRVSTRAAHQAVEHAKRFGNVDAFVEALYKAYWQDGMDISKREPLCDIAAVHVPDVDAMWADIEQNRFLSRIVQFDYDANEGGVYNLPTFFIGDERLAEQPWKRIEASIKRNFPDAARSPTFYSNLQYPAASPLYTVINMAATIDGKIVSGERGEPVHDLGSSVDHLMMRRIQSSVDAVFIGAGSQRSTEKLWYPKELYRIVVTASGNLIAASRFFTDAPEKAVVVCLEKTKLPPLPEGVAIWRCPEVKLTELIERLARELGITKLLIEGGSNINAQAFEQDIVNEIFLTVVPKVKLGENVPTIAGGDPLPRSHLQQFALIEHHEYDNEMFLRYRRVR